MRLTKLAVAWITTLAIAGCVTINIYFPASAAEKAADKIIDEIWQARGSGDSAAPPAASDKKEKP